jgi:hypothetical protein
VKLQEELADRSVKISEDLRGLTVSLAAAGFFDPGSAVMSLEALDAVTDKCGHKL